MRCGHVSKTWFFEQLRSEHSLVMRQVLYNAAHRVAVQARRLGQVMLPEQEAHPMDDAGDADIWQAADAREKTEPSGALKTSLKKSAMMPLQLGAEGL